MTGADVKKAREKLNMTQAELGEAIGMDKNSIARMERDERPVMKTTELSIKYLLLTMRKPRGRK
jgi:transcriptional regulator with XRE-family HTH domain